MAYLDAMADGSGIEWTEAAWKTTTRCGRQGQDPYDALSTTIQGCVLDFRRLAMLTPFWHRT